MKWILIFWLLTILQLVKAQSDKYLTVAGSECGISYYMSLYRSVYLEYDGSNLFTDKCTIEFVNEDSDEMVICVSEQELTVDCGTKLEYHEYFVKDYLDPEKRITCTDTTTSGDWCSSKYTDSLFIVIRKEYRSSSDRIKLRLYRKELDDGITNVLPLVTIIPGVVVLVTVIICICCAVHRRSKSTAVRRAQYQITSGAVTMQTGQGYIPSSQTPAGYQPSPAGYQPLSQGAGSQQLPSGYHVHQMQTAVPVGQNTGQVSVPGFQPQASGFQPQVSGFQPQGPGFQPQAAGFQPQGSGYQAYVPASAPPVREEDVPPPSYDSLWSNRK